MILGDFLSPEAGQQRRAWLNSVDDRIDETLAYYLGPQIMPRVRGAVGAVQAMSPGQDVVDAYTASSDLVRPGSTALDRAGAGATLAGALMMMGMPGGVSSLRQGFNNMVDAGVRAYDPNTVNIFAGPRAKTADLAALDRAKSMAETGASRDAIWSETGWFRGADGNWRFEIDDSGMTLKTRLGGPVQSGDLQSVVRHRDLFSAYPLTDTYAALSDSGFRAGTGSYSQPTYWGFDGPHFNAGDVRDLGRLTARGANAEEVKDVVTHELQHAVQSIEGFAEGSNKSIEAARLAAERDVRLMAEIEARLTPQEAADLARFRELKAVYDGAEVVPGDVVIEVGDLKKRLRRLDEMMDELRTMRAKGQGGALEGGVISDEEAFDAYRRVAGEVEARNASARRAMTPEQRAATPPWATQDVPDADQIVRAVKKYGIAGAAAMLGLSAAEVEAQVARQPMSISRWLEDDDTATLQEYLQ